MRLLAFICLTILAGSSYGGWDLNSAEKEELLARTIHCCFRGRVRLRSDCFSDVDGEFDRLVVVACKDEMEHPCFPYRIRLERNGIAKELFCFVDDEVEWESKVQMLLSERNLILENCVTNAFTSAEPSLPRLVAKSETNGVLYVEIHPPCELLHKTVNNVEVVADDAFESIPYFGDVVRQQWADWDHGLILHRNQSELMRTTNAVKRICAWAVYAAGTMRDTRRGLGEAFRRKKCVKIRIWNEGTEENRANALCVASIALEHLDKGLVCRNIDVERGGEALTVKCGVGTHGEGVCIIFDGCETLIFL